MSTQLNSAHDTIKYVIFIDESWGYGYDPESKQIHCSQENISNSATDFTWATEVEESQMYVHIILRFVVKSYSEQENNI